MGSNARPETLAILAGPKGSRYPDLSLKLLQFLCESKYSYLCSWGSAYSLCIWFPANTQRGDYKSVCLNYTKVINYTSEGIPR